MQQIIPGKPTYMSSEDYALILERDQRRCVHYGKCPHSNGALCCSEHLDFDHRHPKALSGDDSFANICLKCRNGSASSNRGRSLEPDPHWTETDGFWDTEGVLPAKLREVQRIAGWDAISEFERSITEPVRRTLRKVLLGTTTLIAGATGIGKTVLMASVLFRINKLIGIDYPRVKHVLVLVTDDTLRDAAYHEWEEDLAKCGVLDRKPKVHRAKSFDDLIKGPQGADIVVCTVHMLWEVQDSKAAEGVRRTDLEIKRALARFDTLIGDECDWGTDRLKNIGRLASHMLQFAMTATPRVGLLAGNNEFLSKFVMISPTAIATYQDGVNLDQCLKLFATPRKIADNDAYRVVNRGNQKTITTKVQDPDHPLWCSAIMEAISEADKLETRMRRETPNDWYSPHIMVRLEKTDMARLIYDEIKSRLKDRKDLQNPGWDVSMIFRGHIRHLPLADRDPERDLFQKKDNRFVHPFMHAQDTHGQADSHCKRVLLMCNIGVRGLNNWPVSYIVDCTRSDKPFSSITDLIHFAYGRAIRWRDRKTWLSPDPENLLKEFATAHILIPDSSDATAKLEALGKADEFIKSMQQSIGGAGFLTWLDLLEGKRPENVDLDLGADSRALKTEEQWQIQNELIRQAKIAGALTKELIDPVITTCFPDVNPGIREKLERYASRFVAEPDFREKEIYGEPDPATRAEAISVMDKLHPQQPSQYDLDVLRRYVKNSADYNASIRQQYLNGLDSPISSPLYQVAFDAAGKQVNLAQTLNYKESPRLYTLNKKGGVFWELYSNLYQLLDASNTAYPKTPDFRKALYKAVGGATITLFDVGDAKDKGPLDYPAYHIAMKGRYHQTILNMARGMLIRQGLI
jgi:hypothetical protein